MNSLQDHGIPEVKKQLRLRMKNSGLDTIQVQVTRGSGKHKISFTGSPEHVAQAKKILADWS
jgi:predicted ATP-dependent Lon-type protease